MLSQYSLGLRDPVIHPRGGYEAAALTTFVSLLVAAGALAGAVVLELRGGELPVAPTTISLLALVVALVAGCVFVALRPGRYVGVGFDFFVFGGGVIAGIAASVLLAKLLVSRHDDDAEG
jgi:hypothetical protein